MAAVWQGDIARRAEGKATDEAKKAKKSEDRATENEARAKAQTAIATSRRLASLSVLERSRRLERSLLLAVEALGSENTFEASDCLFNALHDRPGLSSFLHVKEGDVTDVAFSPDGKTLAAGYGYDYVRGVVLFDADLESWQRLAGRIANRNFTRDEWRQFFPDEPYRRTVPGIPLPTDDPLYIKPARTQ